jgi:bifunctional DNA primase/polymerase-like protein
MSPTRTPGAADRARLGGWLDLAARGWALFPVLPVRKQPAIAAWSERATTDPERIARFFTAHPDHNAGLACGPSGLLVLDCDTPKPDTPDHGRTDDGAAVLARLAAPFGGLPDTWTVITPSGGRHLYFRQPPDGEPLGNTVRTLGALLDTRGAGGYVLAPGCRLPNGAYELEDDTDPASLPGWMTLRLAAGPSPAVSAASERPCIRVGDHRAYVAAVVSAELQRVAEARRGGHNAAVFTAARALGQLAAAGLLDHAHVEHDLTEAAAHIVAGPCDCTARDVAASIRSGLAHGARRPRQLPAPRTVRRSA